MSYLLVPGEQATTRLLLKVVMATNRVIAPALSVGDLIMARRQLLNLKELAERGPSHGTHGPHRRIPKRRRAGTEVRNCRGL